MALEYCVPFQGMGGGLFAGVTSLSGVSQTQ